MKSQIGLTLRVDYLPQFIHNPNAIISNNYNKIVVSKSGLRF